MVISLIHTEVGKPEVGETLTEYEREPNGARRRTNRDG